MSSPSEHSGDYSSDDGFVKISQPDVVSVSSDSDLDVVSVSSESESDDGEMPDLVPVQAVTAQAAAATASKLELELILSQVEVPRAVEVGWYDTPLATAIGWESEEASKKSVFVAAHSGLKIPSARPTRHCALVGAVAFFNLVLLSNCAGLRVSTNEFDSSLDIGC